jgi:phage terminase large subunit-like protein
MTLEEFKTLPIETRLEALDKLRADEKQALLYHWPFFARESQMPPEAWGTGGCYLWIIRAGRGWGKTKTGAETLIQKIREGYRHTSICAATAAECRDVLVRGESGILSCCPPWFFPEYKPSERKLFWPNGAVTNFFYGSEPELSRGAQSDFLWIDELHKFQYPQETLDNLLLGLRLGDSPLALITSTPKPTRLCRELEAKKNADGTPASVVTVGSTMENQKNLSPVFLNAITTQYAGTRLGLQELSAEILDDNPYSLFKRENLERDAVDIMPPPENISRVLVAVDPAASANEKSNHTGIIVLAAGKAPDKVSSGPVQHTELKHFYILDDLSLIGQPYQWGSVVKMAVDQYEAGKVLYESNQGGDMVRMVLQSAGVKAPIIPVRAVADKERRALPASQASAQGRIHLVKANDLSFFVDELTNWVPGDDSPDRLDAFVHGFNYLETAPEAKPLSEEGRKGIVWSVDDSWG